MPLPSLAPQLPPPPPRPVEEEENEEEDEEEDEGEGEASRYTRYTTYLDCFFVYRRLILAISADGEARVLQSLSFVCER